MSLSRGREQDALAVLLETPWIWTGFKAYTLAEYVGMRVRFCKESPPEGLKLDAAFLETCRRAIRGWLEDLAKSDQPKLCANPIKEGFRILRRSLPEAVYDPFKHPHECPVDPEVLDSILPGARGQNYSLGVVWQLKFSLQDLSVTDQLLLWLRLYHRMGYCEIQRVLEDPFLKAHYHSELGVETEISAVAPTRKLGSMRMAVVRAKRKLVCAFKQRVEIATQIGFLSKGEFPYNWSRALSTADC